MRLALGKQAKVLRDLGAFQQNAGTAPRGRKTSEKTQAPHPAFGHWVWRERHFGAQPNPEAAVPSKKTQAPTRLRKTAWHCGQRVMAITPGLCEPCCL
jgi:hypothetical protein